MSSMGRAMTSSAPASRSAMRSSTESDWASASTGTASESGIGLEPCHHLGRVDIRRAVHDHEAGVDGEVERRGTERRRDDTSTKPRQCAWRVGRPRRVRRTGASRDRSEGSTAATLAGVRGSLDRSYGAGTKVGPSRAIRGLTARSASPGTIPGLPASVAAGLGAVRRHAAILRARPFSSAVRVSSRPTQPERGISHGKEHEYPCVAMS